MRRETDSNAGMQTMGGHLEVMRNMILRVTAVTVCVAVVVFCQKERAFELILAPAQWDFVTYRYIEKLAVMLGWPLHFEPFEVDMITTDLSSQFMTHVTMALYIGIIIASPYIVYELFRFVAPALYDSERRYSVRIVVIVYLLFIVGVLMCYYLLFPISFRFLGTYSVDSRVHTAITLDSYISTFVTLTLMMGAVFQLPVLSWTLARMGLLDDRTLSRYRRHAALIIVVVAAVITPPDLMTLVFVAVPLYLLYEVSILVVRYSVRAGN
ncbi:MAG: twin-arginine translocase subunit TatC [Pseudoflavonifractor sp.]|nr:twin-arginine translocase subunit TatC [Pseudoflavonifractor sp.]